MRGETLNWVLSLNKKNSFYPGEKISAVCVCIPSSTSKVGQGCAGRDRHVDAVDECTVGNACIACQHQLKLDISYLAFLSLYAGVHDMQSVRLKLFLFMPKKCTGKMELLLMTNHSLFRDILFISPRFKCFSGVKIFRCINFFFKLVYNFVSHAWWQLATLLLRAVRRRNDVTSRKWTGMQTWANFPPVPILLQNISSSNSPGDDSFCPGKKHLTRESSYIAMKVSRF